MRMQDESGSDGEGVKKGKRVRKWLKGILGKKKA